MRVSHSQRGQTTCLATPLLTEDFNSQAEDPRQQDSPTAHRKSPWLPPDSHTAHGKSPWLLPDSPTAHRKSPWLPPDSPSAPRTDYAVNDFSTSFPPLVVKPRNRDCFCLTIISLAVLSALVVSQRQLETRGVGLELLLKYLSIPVVSILFTYFHIWVALWMTFYPVKFRGCLQIPGTNVGLGWQGIVPSKSEKMARKACRLMTTRLLDVGEVFARIDPSMVAQELGPVVHSMLTTIIHEVGVQEEPKVWAKLPAMVKNELILKAREEAPPVIEAMMEDVQANIRQVFDLEEMVVGAFVQKPNLLNHMFIKCGYKELKFIRDCGGYMGGVFGIMQVALWIVYSAGWMLPAFGLIVGLLTNWLALKMIFEPVEPRHLLCGITLQGLFLRRQPEVSKEYGKVVARHVLSARYLIPAIITGRCSDTLFELVHRHVQVSCDNYVGPAGTVVKLVSGKEKFTRCKQMVGDRLVESLEDTMTHVERYIDSAMDLQNLIGDKLAKLPPSEFEDLLHPVFQEDEWKLVLMGGVLGAVVGFLQWYTLGS